MLFAPEESLRGGGGVNWCVYRQPKFVKSVQLAWDANIRLVDKKNKSIIEIEAFFRYMA